MTRTLKQKTVSGVKWVFVCGIIQRVLSLGATAILARLLSPADFGLFALAFVMIDGFGIFKSLGFDSALVRRKDDIGKAANTAFFLIPTMGLVLFIILFFLAPYGAKFLNNPDVSGVIRALSVIFIIHCFGKVPDTILQREMKFKAKSIAEISAQVFYVTTALILAFNKFGVWSLVIAYITKTAVWVSLLWYFAKWRPDFKFNKAIAWDMFHFGKFVLASAIIWFLYGNLDNILIGKLLGVTMLGYYAIAKNASNLLNDYFLGKIGMIMYPAYSKIQDDPDDVRNAMLKVLKYISIIVFPFSFGLFIFAPDVLRVVFGPKWLPAVNVLRILAPTAIFGALGSAIWPAFLAKGRSKIDLQLSLVMVTVFILLVIPLGMKFQLVGVGTALLLSNMISFTVGLIRIRRIISIKLSKIFTALKPALLCSALMAVVAVFLKSAMPVKNINYHFLLIGAFAVLIYSLAMYGMNRNILREMREVLA